MERGGPFTGGENPEDPDGAGDDAGAPQRGWLSPEDRLWRHPSEVAGLGPPRSASSYFSPGVERRAGRLGPRWRRASWVRPPSPPRWLSSWPSSTPREPAAPIRRSSAGPN